MPNSSSVNSSDAVLMPSEFKSPHAQIGKFFIRSIHLAVTIAVELGQCRIAVRRAVGKQRGIAKQLAAVVDYAVAIAVRAPATRHPASPSPWPCGCRLYCDQTTRPDIARRYCFNAVAIKSSIIGSTIWYLPSHGSLTKSPKSLANGINQSPKSFCA